MTQRNVIIFVPHTFIVIGFGYKICMAEAVGEDLRCYFRPGCNNRIHCIQQIELPGKFDCIFGGSGVISGNHSLNDAIAVVSLQRFDVALVTGQDKACHIWTEKNESNVCKGYVCWMRCTVVDYQGDPSFCFSQFIVPFFNSRLKTFPSHKQFLQC